MSELSVLAGLVLSNFLYQWASNTPDFWTASERSVFQVFAVCAVLFFQKGSP